MEAASRSSEQPRRRRGLVFTLIAIASLVGFLATFAIWANRQLLETDTWTETSTELLEDKEIRDAVSGFLVDSLFAEVNVQAELENTLPPNLRGLAGPIAGGVRQLAGTLADKALAQPRVQQLWEQANRTAHETLIAVIESDAVDEGVTLDLGTIVDQVGQRVGLDVSDKLPPDVGELEVLPPDELSTARDIVDLMKTLAIVLFVVALALFALAVYLARGWRREALRTIGFAFIGVGIAVLVARGLAGNLVVSTLADTAAAEPAVENTWSIGTSLLADGGSSLIFYGIVILLGAWLAGPVGIARESRRGITPVLEQRQIAYSALALVLLLLFWWSPTPGFERWPIAIVIIALFVAGVEALRAQAIREFPDQTWETASGRLRERARSLVRRGTGGGDDSPGAGPPPQA